MTQIYVLALRHFADHDRCPHCGSKARYRDGDVMLEGYCCEAGEALKKALAALEAQDALFERLDRQQQEDVAFGEHQAQYLESLTPGEKPTMKGFMEFKPKE